MYRYAPLILFLGFVLLQCDNTKKSKTTYHPHKLDKVPYSESVQVGDILYISGQIANTDHDYNKVVDGGIRAQVNQTMKNIQKHVIFLEIVNQTNALKYMIPEIILLEKNV